MSFRSICRSAAGVAALSLAVGLGACGPSVNQAWNGPGWYLQKPYMIVLGGPVYFGGPYSYDKCEEERIRQPEEVRASMVCVRENRKPERYGFY